MRHCLADRRWPSQHHRRRRQCRHVGDQRFERHRPRIVPGQRLFLSRRNAGARSGPQHGFAARSRVCHCQRISQLRRLRYSFGYKTASGAGNFYTVMAYGDSGQSPTVRSPIPTSPSVVVVPVAWRTRPTMLRSLNQTMPLVMNFRATVVPDRRQVRGDFDGTAWPTSFGATPVQARMPSGDPPMRPPSSPQVPWPPTGTWRGSAISMVTSGPTSSGAVPVGPTSSGARAWPRPSSKSVQSRPLDGGGGRRFRWRWRIRHPLA